MNTIEDAIIISIYHFAFLDLIACLSGINLNYMLSPPPKGPLIKYGKKYRMIQLILMVIAWTLFGFIFPKILLFYFC